MSAGFPCQLSSRTSKVEAFLGASQKNMIDCGVRGVDSVDSESFIRQSTDKLEYRTCHRVLTVSTSQKRGSFVAEIKWASVFS